MVRMSCRGHGNIQSKLGFYCLMGSPFSSDYYKLVLSKLMATGCGTSAREATIFEGTHVGWKPPHQYFSHRNLLLRFHLGKSLCLLSKPSEGCLWSRSLMFSHCKDLFLLRKDVQLFCGEKQKYFSKENYTAPNVWSHENGRSCKDGAAAKQRRSKSECCRFKTQRQQAFLLRNLH